MSAKVKICGITSFEDALAAVEAGADILGYNFYPASPRFIPANEAHEIQDHLARRGITVTAVGVFVNAPPELVRKTVADTGIDYAQLSGDEEPGQLRSMNAFAFKAIRPRSETEAEALASLYANPSVVPALLLDAHHPTLYGGTGSKADQAIARRLADSHPILLAGGLNPDNVASAVEAADPWGVDVASGVETAPGIKDHAKMRDFIRRAKGLA